MFGYFYRYMILVCDIFVVSQKRQVICMYCRSDQQLRKKFWNYWKDNYEDVKPCKPADMEVPR